MIRTKYNEIQQDCNLFERKDQTLIVTIEVSDLVTIEMRNDVLKSLRELLDSVQPETHVVIRIFSHEILALFDHPLELDWKEYFEEIMKDVEHHHLLSLDPFQRQRPILFWDAWADSIRDIYSDTLILLVGIGEDLGSKESKDSVADMLNSKVKGHSKLVFFRLPCPSASVDPFLKGTPTEFEFVHVESCSNISKMFRHVMNRSTTHSKLLNSDPEKISHGLDIQIKSPANVEICDVSQKSTDLLDAIREVENAGLKIFDFIEDVVFKQSYAIDEMNKINPSANLYQEGVNLEQGSKTAHQNDLGTSPGGTDKEESTIEKENNKISLMNKSKLEDQVVEEGKIENGRKPEFPTFTAFNSLNWIPERIELKEAFRFSFFCIIILLAVFAHMKEGRVKSEKQVELLKSRVNWLEKAVFEMQMQRAQLRTNRVFQEMEMEKGNWKSLNGLQIPEGSLKISESGSSNLNKAYIARAYLNGELIVGKIVQEKDGGISTWFPIPEEQMPPLTHLQTLVIEQNQVSWIPISPGTSRNLVLDFAVGGGVNQNGQKIFIGRSIHNRELVAGSVMDVEGDLQLSFKFEKTQIQKNEFDVLFYQKL